MTGARRGRRIAVRFLVVIACVCATAAAARAAEPASFAEFDRRAKAGERLSVVFFGASLTWGANASDPMLTSYRGLVSRRLEERYPEAHFRFWDAAIGGTGSQLGVFRLERDVLARKPDLVFLDFSANDGIYEAKGETLASYEALVRRVVVDGRAPVVQVVFPFRWDIERGNTDGMLRRDAHHAIAQAYHSAIGDAITLCQERVKSGAAKLGDLWPYDGVHPGDRGYEVFADAAWQAFVAAVEAKQVCQAPANMLHADTYMHSARVRISSLGLPRGWRLRSPNPVSAYFDMLMSRWLDEEVAAHRKKGTNTLIEPLRARFYGSMLMLFGESTMNSVKYRVLIDGKVVEHKSADGKQTLTEFDAGFLANRLKGNTHHPQVIAEGLDPAKEHFLVIEPLFSGDAEQELRLESICVAGGRAQVYSAQD